MTGHLKSVGRYYHMVFSYQNNSGEWQTKSETTGLLRKGNKKKAQAMLNARLVELEETLESSKENETSFIAEIASAAQSEVKGYLRDAEGQFVFLFSYIGTDGTRQKRERVSGLPVEDNKRKSEAMLKKLVEEINTAREQLLKGQEQPTQLEQEVLIDIKDSYNPPLNHAVYSQFPQYKMLLDGYEHFLNHVAVNHVKQSTLTEYKKVFNRHIKSFELFQGVETHSLSRGLVSAFCDAKVKEMAPTSVRKISSNIHKFFNYLISIEYVRFNPTDNVIIPKGKKYKHNDPYDLPMLKELLNRFEGDTLEHVVLFTCTYGFRRSEIVGIKEKAFDFKNDTLKIHHTGVVDGNTKVIYEDSTKNDEERLYPLTPQVKESALWLIEQKKLNRAMLKSKYYDSPYLFTWSDGRPFHPNYLTKHFTRIMKKNSDLPYLRLHDLRHSVAYVLRREGLDAKDIQIWLGHSDVTTTLRIYSHILDQDMEDMKNIMQSVAQFEKSTKNYDRER